MDRDPLTQLLKDADVAPPRFGAPHDVVAFVRRRHARQRAFRRGALTCGFLVLATTLALFNVSHRSKSPTVRSDAPDLAALFIEADLHELTANKLLATASTRRANARELTSNIDAVQLQRDRAALVIVYQANQHLSDHRTDLAIAGYHKAIELFPQTHWADVARQRLRELQT